MIVLSPFVVDASKDQGYRATSTLAGSRINTPLKDVAAPITVLTKEFLDDLGAVGINDVMSYLANGEGTGSYTDTVQSLGAPIDNIASNSAGANRVRGLASVDITRDYFYTIGDQFGFDTYNLDQVTLSRGPNSILAGLGSAAGILNYSPQVAALSGNKNEVALRFGSWGDKRATFNGNFVAIPNKLAFRVAAAWTDKGYKQKPSFSHDKRFYGALTYQPWTKTTIRMSFEDAKIKRTVPNTLTPLDGVTQWVDFGKPTATYGQTPSYSFPNGNWGGVTLIYNKDGVLEGSRQTNQPFGYTFTQQNVSGAKIWNAYRLNSNKYLNLQSLNTNAQLADMTYKTFSASVDQNILPNLYASLAYIHEAFDSSTFSVGRADYTDMRIDVNTIIPATGAANPHFGELYMEQRGLDNKRDRNSTNSVARATLNYDLDLTKHNKWFGKWRVTAFAEDRKTETEYNGYTIRAVINGALSEVYNRYYLGGTLTTPATVGPVFRGLVSGVAYTYFDSTSGTFKQTTYNTAFTQSTDNEDHKQLVKLKTSAVVLQGYLWDDRIVGMVGLRDDTNKVGDISQRAGQIAPGTPYPALTELSAKTKTYSLVYHALNWLSFHYNKSGNFIPNAGSIDLLGNPTASPTGQSKDYGISFNLLDDKLNIKLNHFEIQAKDGPAGSGAAFVSQWAMPWFDTVVMKDLAAVAGNTTYKPGLGAGIGYGDARLQNGYTANNVSKGLELEATYNVSKNWRIMGNISKQEASQSGVALPLTDFIKTRIAYYKAQGLWNGPVGGAIWNAAQTGEATFNQWVLPSQLDYQSNDGKPSQQIAKWHASGLTTYTFTEGKLKGWDVGGGLRYTDKAIIGNPVTLNSSGAVTGLDVANPYYVGSRIGVDAWVGYKMKIMHDKYWLSFNLYGYDLQESGHFHPILANSDGAHSVYRIVNPRSFYFTTKLSF